MKTTLSILRLLAHSPVAGVTLCTAMTLGSLSFAIVESNDLAPSGPVIVDAAIGDISNDINVKDTGLSIINSDPSKPASAGNLLSSITITVTNDSTTEQSVGIQVTGSGAAGSASMGDLQAGSKVILNANDNKNGRFISGVSTSNGATIGDVAGSIEVNGSMGSLIGFDNSGANMGDIKDTASIAVNSTGSAFTYGLRMVNANANGQAIRVDGDISAQSMAGQALAIQINSASAIDEIGASSTISAISNTHQAVGIYAMGDLGGIAGDVIATSTMQTGSAAIGIYSSGSSNLATKSGISGNVTSSAANALSVAIWHNAGNVMGDILEGANITALGTGKTSVDAIIIESQGSGLGNVAGNVVSSLTESNNNNDATGIRIKAGTTMGNLTETSSVTVRTDSTNNQSDSFGIHMMGEMGSVAGNISSSSNAGQAYGIYLGGHTGTITGNIESSSSNGSAYGVVVTENASMGVLDEHAKISAISTGSQYADSAVGIHVMGETKEIRGEVTASSKSGNAVAIHADANATLGTITSTARINAHSDLSNTGSSRGSYAISYKSKQALTIEHGASIRATMGANGRSYGTAIENTQNGITLRGVQARGSSASSVHIYGNMNAGQHAMTFESGSFDIDSNYLVSTEVNFGSWDGTNVTTSNVNISSSTAMSASVLNFYMNSVSDLSQLTIASDSSLTLLEGCVINVYMSDALCELAEAGALGDITIVSGDIQGVNVNDFVINAYDCNGNTQGGTNFIVDPGGLIPEPSTATLSLLALAGLMARRRRQRVA